MFVLKITMCISFQKMSLGWDLLEDEEFGDPFDALIGTKSLEDGITEIFCIKESSQIQEADVFIYSVTIFPPPPSMLSREYFKLIFLPAIKKILEVSEISVRGWRSQKEFELEFEAALRSRTCSLDGIVVARKQSEEEALFLAQSMKELQVKCGVFL